MQSPWNPPERREPPDEALSPVFRIGNRAAAAIDVSPGDIDDLSELIGPHGPSRKILSGLDSRTPRRARRK